MGTQASSTVVFSVVFALFLGQMNASMHTHRPCQSPDVGQNLTCAAGDDRSTVLLQQISKLTHMSSVDDDTGSGVCPYHANSATDCGFHGITQQECEARGCCWDPTSPMMWCYPRGAVLEHGDEGTCPYHANSGDDCGFSGITQEQCEERGCCWDPTSPNMLCYPRGPAVGSEQEGTTVRPVGTPQPTDKQPKFVVHFMPWFTGEGGSHWCNQRWGNSYYDSVFGQYNTSDPSVFKRQLQLMKKAGIDGLWIDFQQDSWVQRITPIVEEAARLDLRFAIVADYYSDEFFPISMRQAIQAFMRMPNYYVIDSRPILPIFEYPFKWGGRPAVLPDWEVDGKRPLIIGTYHFNQDETQPLPVGIDSTFFWNSPDIAWQENAYYHSTRFAMKVGSVFRGWRDAYEGWSHAAPYLGYLNATLTLALEQQPEFVQIVTWNDYTEGTMIEPSYLRTVSRCTDPPSVWVTEEPCKIAVSFNNPCTPAVQNVPCVGSGEVSCASIEDCTKPLGVETGRGAVGCNVALDDHARSAYTDLATVGHAITGRPMDQLIQDFEEIVSSITW